MKTFISLIVSCVIALPVAFSQPQTHGTVFLNTEAATKQFNEINEKLSAPKVALSTLTRHVENLEDLQEKAQVCVEKSESELKKINDLINSSTIEKSILIQQAEYKYLQDKKAFYAKQLSECRFYIYRSKEALVGYKNIIQNLTTHQLLGQRTPLWKIDPSEIFTGIKDIDYHAIYTHSGLSNLGLAQIFLSLIIIVLSIATTLYITSLAKQWLKQQLQIPSKILALVTVLSRFVIPLTLFATVSALSAVLFADIPYNHVIQKLSTQAFFFILVIAVLKYLFNPPQQNETLFNLPKHIGQALFHRATALLAWLFIGMLCATLFKNQYISAKLVDFVRLLYLSVSIGLIIALLMTVYQTPLMQALKSQHQWAVQALAGVLLTCILIIEWLGFHQLAIFTLKSILQTAGLAMLLTALLKFIHYMYLRLEDTRYTTAKKMRLVLGIKPHKKIKEILVLKHIAYFLAAYGALLVLMKIWGAPPNLFDLVTDSFDNGFAIAEAKVTPRELVIAVMAFVGTLLLGRTIATQVARKARFEDEADTQVAMASLVLYMTFAVALMLALLLVGVNFTSLAIIAGALSVGVGLGLQDVVNNFISGLVLLIEKPVKPGDRVVVGGTEGFIKRIRLRSTRITTVAKEDVIIPNADLVTNQVTNYMFQDRSWRIVCQVGVAYGSPIELVKSLLLEVASEHEDVVQTAPNQPAVLFKEFGDSALIFELWCVIHDVNKKFFVTSDLNFLIDAIFRKHRIVIPFPQRDVHVINHPKEISAKIGNTSPSDKQGIDERSARDERKK